MSLPLRAEAFIADNPGIPFKYIIGVFEDAMRNVPSPEYAEQYWKNLGSPEGLAVFSDVNEQLLPSTPFTGTQASGKCLLRVPALYPEVIDHFLAASDFFSLLLLVLA